MRIPLDYYRILSVPVKATKAQLEQACQDRLLQQPRREYSDLAKKARQQLIQYAYQVLSDSEQRASYDAQFLLNMQLAAPEKHEPETEAAVEEELEIPGEIESVLPPVANPTIEIAANQIVGALLILHELGEYETVLSIGINDYNCREAESEQLGVDILDSTQEDLILVLSLAYMELGREQWHRREYENAALSGQLGIDLLEQKSLFPHIQSELEQDLAKLRPYRVLELISQNPAKSVARDEGFKLLQSMLVQRQGIEGKGEDRSGLNFDQFLCFVQQLRTYLTSAEQQQLFDNKSQSKSAIANYLSVYALLARGFCLKKPELVLRAQRKLDYLSEKQDVSWEQSITALLLGHTQKAIQKLKSAPDPRQLQQVQQHSLGSSDLLPGLCFYGEQWLLQDVAAQFNDLSTTDLTLKSYFAEPQVQAYLEQLAPPSTVKTAVPTESQSKPAVKARVEADSASGIMSLWRNVFSSAKPAKVRAAQNSVAVSQEIAGGTIARDRGSTAIMERSKGVVSPTPKRSGSMPPHNPRSNHRINHPPSPSGRSLSLPLQPEQSRAVPPSVIQKAHRRKKRSPATIWKGWLFIIGLILGVGTIGNLGMKLLLSSNKTAEQAQLTIAVDRPSVDIPTPKAKPVAPKPKPTFKQQSQQVIQDWLSNKSAALGKEHQIDKLNDILAEPLLTTWRDRAVIYQQENTYREYEHGIVMRSATIDPANNNKARVEAEVKEMAKHYQNGQLDNSQSYDDNLLVRYQLVRQGEKWLIEGAEVLETL